MHLKKAASICLLVFLVACAREEHQQNPITDSVDPPEEMSHELGPFFQAETAMFDEMLAAIGVSSDDSWVRMMIAHHEGGAAISRVMLQEDPPPRIADLAKRITQAQEEAADELQMLLRAGPLNVEGALIFLRPIQAMRLAIMAVDGSDVSEVWLRKMIEHHRGAIEMSDTLLAQRGIPEEVAGAVRRLRNEQRQNLTVLERTLFDLNSERAAGS